MHVTASTPQTPERPVRRFGLTEFFGLRRHPHPEFCESVAQLPPTLAALAESALPSGQPVRGALVVPAEYLPRRMLMWEYVPERALIFLPQGALYVRAEGPETRAEVVMLDGHSLLYVRSSLLLLYGLLEFKADCGSQPAEVRLEYNTVIWHALRGPLGELIAVACGSGAGTDPVASTAMNAPLLGALPFKFANGLRYYALEPGERLLVAVFQPSLWERRGLLPYQVTPNTLLGLTDRKLVMIEEQRSMAWRRQSTQGEYGWIFTYIPVDRVVDMVVTPGARSAAVTVRLAWGGATAERCFLLEPAIAVRWEQAWRKHLN